MTPSSKAVIQYLHKRSSGTPLAEILAIMPEDELDARLTLGILARAVVIVRCGRDAQGSTLWKLADGGHHTFRTEIETESAPA